MVAGTVNFASPEMAEKAPLAQRLFGIDGVKGVFFGADFVSVAKSEATDWQTLEPAVTAGIEAHFASGDPVVLPQEDHGADDDGEDDIDDARDHDDAVEHDTQDGGDTSNENKTNHMDGQINDEDNISVMEDELEFLSLDNDIKDKFLELREKGSQYNA